MNGQITSGPRRLSAAVAWIAFLALLLFAFTALGRGALAAPPLAAPASWSSWAEGREPAVIVFAVLRLAVLAVAWYLLGVSVVGVVARILRAGRLIALADLVTVPAVRRLLQTTMGLTLATAAVASAAAPARAAVGPPPVTATAPAEEGASGDDLLMGPGVTQGDVQGSPSSALPVPFGLPPPAPWVTRDEEPSTPAPTWEVRAGEHFWSIAEQVLAERWKRPPTADEVERYWRALVEQNRSQLADPRNPDLVYPGQVFTLPAS